MIERSAQSPWLEWLAGDAYSHVWKAVIRPPRCIYTLSELGPARFELQGRRYEREDLSLTSLRGYRLECSHYRLAQTDDLASSAQEAFRAPRPCVVYLHGCSSSRLEVLDVLPVLLPLQLDVFCLDFAGSGLSGGELVSLGHYEEKDLGVVIGYLRKSGKASSIGLWGRSMGAATAILRAAKDRCLAACVLDSPFCDLRSIAKDLVTKALPVPQWVLDACVDAVRAEVLARAGFDPDEVSPLRSAPRARCPALLAVASDDSFVQPHHARDLHDAWGGHRALRSFEGGHNGDRPDWFLEEAARFLALQLFHEDAERQALPSQLTGGLLLPAVSPDDTPSQQAQAAATRWAALAAGLLDLRVEAACAGGCGASILLPRPRAAVHVKATLRRAGALLGVARRRPQRRARSSGWRRGCGDAEGGAAADGAALAQCRSRSL